MDEWPLAHIKIAIRGGGDLGTGIACRLHRAGFPLLILELPQPVLVRRAVSFGSAVFEESITVEGLAAHRAADLDQALTLQQNDRMPVLVDPDGASLNAYQPAVLIDARMLKGDPGQQPYDAPLIIGTGPGFRAGKNCHAAIETNRGHNLGRVLWNGATADHTHRPGAVLGYAEERVLRAPAAGTVIGLAAIGEQVKAGQALAQVGGEAVYAPFDGVLRGLVHDGVAVSAGRKIGDLDPRGIVEYCFTISDKALAIGGAVLEAVLSSPALRRR